MCPDILNWVKIWRIGGMKQSHTLSMRPGSLVRRCFSSNVQCTLAGVRRICRRGLYDIATLQVQEAPT